MSGSNVHNHIHSLMYVYSLQHFTAKRLLYSLQVFRKVHRRPSYLEWRVHQRTPGDSAEKSYPTLTWFVVGVGGMEFDRGRENVLGRGKLVGLGAEGSREPRDSEEETEPSSGS